MSYLPLLFAFITGMVVAFLMRREATLYALRQARKMQDESSMFKSAFDNSSIGMAIVGPGGGIVKVNDAFCQMVGYTREELGGVAFQKITHPDDVDADEALFHRMLSGEIVTYQMEKRYIRKDGSTCHAHLSVSATYRTNSDGERVLELFISQIQDRNLVVSQRVELERKNAELSESYAIVTRALSAISDQTMDQITERVKAAPYVGLQ